MITLFTIIRPKSLTIVVLLALCLGSTSVHAQFDPQHIRAVDTSATGNNDGTSWENAYNFLKDALTFASVPQNGITEIWVAKGIYAPDRDTSNPGGTENREATFLLDFNNITILGGFIGTEDDSIYRNPELNVTTLTGNLGSNSEIICGDAESGSCTEANGIPGCEDTDCCSMVCVVILDCCEVAWDQACVDMASVICGICGEPEAGNCFIGNDTPGCDDADCCALICEVDTFCCETQWDDGCAAVAKLFCPPEDDPRAYHVVTVNGVDENVRLDGFTITQGLADDFEDPNGNGAGMLILDASPTVVRVTFIDNSAPAHGGGAIRIQGASSPMIVNTTFIQNTGNSAGAILIESVANGGTFVNCLFRDNVTQFRGGAITFWYSSTFNSINCTFVDNSTVNSETGAGAIFVKSNEPFILTSCILWGNLGGGIPNQILAHMEDIIVTYSDIQGGWVGTANIDENPEFIDAASDNYRLELESPCFDKGNPDEKVIPVDIFDVDQDTDEKEITPDLDGLKRIVNCSVDMGVYEISCPWDLNSSGFVGTSDLLALFTQWGTDGSADFSCDGIVGTADLLILFVNWGPCG